MRLCLAQDIVGTQTISTGSLIGVNGVLGFIIRTKPDPLTLRVWVSSMTTRSGDFSARGSCRKNTVFQVTIFFWALFSEKHRFMHFVDRYYHVRFSLPRPLLLFICFFTISLNFFHIYSILINASNEKLSCSDLFFRAREWYTGYPLL